MAGLVPAIHDFLALRARESKGNWSSPDLADLHLSVIARLDPAIHAMTSRLAPTATSRAARSNNAGFF
jgi:hypothetical protein